MKDTELDAGLRSLWRTQPTEVFSQPPDAVRAKAEKFKSQVAARNARECAAAAFVAVTFGAFAVLLPGPILRAGCLLAVAGALYVAWYIRTHAGADELPDIEATSCLDFHRRQLERQRDLLKRIWIWYLGPLLPGPVVMMVGFAVRSPNPLYSFAVDATMFGLVFAGFGLVNRYAARKLQAEIDALPTERGHDATEEP